MRMKLPFALYSPPGTIPAIDDSELQADVRETGPYQELAAVRGTLYSEDETPSPLEFPSIHYIIKTEFTVVDNSNLEAIVRELAAIEPWTYKADETHSSPESPGPPLYFHHWQPPAMDESELQANVREAGLHQEWIALRREIQKTDETPSSPLYFHHWKPTAE